MECSIKVNHWKILMRERKEQRKSCYPPTFTLKGNELNSPINRTKRNSMAEKVFETMCLKNTFPESNGKRFLFTQQPKENTGSHMTLENSWVLNTNLS